LIRRDEAAGRDGKRGQKKFKKFFFIFKKYQKTIGNLAGA
jgi:hypothetical protein